LIKNHPYCHNTHLDAVAKQFLKPKGCTNVNIDIKFKAMKNKLIILTLSAGICLFAACSGDQTAQTGKDTVNNRFGVGKDTTKVDTAKITSGDNSASGGANLVKDTSKKQAPK
jgi:hypothetical protein